MAGKIYDDMIDFAKYAFNKSHAACYAVVSFQTAYLKTYYPVEFMAALMTSVIDNTSKVAGYIYACKQMNIGILPPDVNESQMEFTVENGKIRFAMAAIKSLGRPTIQAILKERGENGSFISMQDFVTRMSHALNRRAIENFVKAGAFDTFGHTRKSMMIVSESMLDSAIKHNKDSMTGQMSLFDFAAEEDKKAFEIRIPDVAEYTKEELLGYEKEILGVYVSGHPLDEYTGMVNKYITNVSSTSLPCTIAASSSVSAVECGQNRQCIPISVKIFTTASIAASEQERSTSPTVISLLIMRGTSFPGARLGAPLFYDTPERRICQPFRQENHSISTGRSESLNGFSPSYASSCTFLFRATGALVTDCM